MKKSFLKRAIASAVAVPIALTQCIMPVLAVDVPTDIAVMADTAVTTHLTADSFTNIDPDKTESNWNEVFAGILITQPDFTRDINPSVVTDFIVSNAGNYKDFAKQMIAGNRDYFVCDMPCTTAIQVYMNGEPYQPLLSQATVDAAMQENKEKALRE